jgi:cyclophilin family peptidyl-prolyl cis-trans isomerase
MKTKKLALLLISFSALILLAACGSKQWDSPPPMSIDQARDYEATISTNYGDIVLELFPDEAPIAVNNFVFLARQGFYDGLTFHRVVKGFVIQGGDPKGDGSGGPGYYFQDEPVTRDYVYGTLAMANAGADTNGSQFFITLANLNLPKQYTIFGIMTQGSDVLSKIESIRVSQNDSGEWSLPDAEIRIKTITITEK